MRAVVIRQFGDPRNLKIEEVPTPQPAAGEILVQVRAASINPSDAKNVTGHMHRTTLPRVPGRDFAGVVVRGPAKLVGREVFGTGGDVGFVRDGSHAQFIAVPSDGVTLKPAALSMEAAGLAGVTFVAAWSAMVVAAQIARGETALIIGATGGVGSAAVQIAAWRGATVIGAVRAEQEIADARRFGAHEVINTTSEKLSDAVHRLTGGAGAAVVFDSSGMMFHEAIEAAASDARVPVIAAPPDGHASLNLRSVYRKELRIHGVDTIRLDTVASAKILQQLLPGFESGAIKVHPGEPYPLSKAAEAYQIAAKGGHRIVLRPDL